MADPIKVDDVKLAELYSAGGVYHATVMIAVVFAQFSVLAFLQGRAALLLTGNFSIVILTILYCVIVAAGCYFADSFLKFTQLLDGITVGSSNATLQKLHQDVGECRSKLRKIIAEHSILVLAAYVLASTFALIAMLCMTGLGKA